jgi:hypothetical protein
VRALILAFHTSTVYPLLYLHIPPQQLTGISISRMQVDEPTANEATPAVKGKGRKRALSPLEGKTTSGGKLNNSGDTKEQDTDVEMDKDVNMRANMDSNGDEGPAYRLSRVQKIVKMDSMSIT